MFRQMVGVETAAIIGFDQAQAAIVLLGERAAAQIHVIEDPIFHRALPWCDELSEPSSRVSAYSPRLDSNPELARPTRSPRESQPAWQPGHVRTHLFRRLARPSRQCASGRIRV